MTQRLLHLLLALGAAAAGAVVLWAGGSPASPVLSPAKALAACSCAQARLEGQAVFARVLAQRQDARPLFLFAGRFDAGDYVCLAFSGQMTIHRVKGGAAETSAPIPVPPGPLVVFRKGRDGAVFVGDSLAARFDAGDGAADLLAAWPKDAPEADAFRVRAQDATLPRFEDDFMRGPADQGGAWETVGGVWRVAQVADKGAGPNAFSLLASGAGRIMTGHPFWTDYLFSAAVRVETGGEAGLVFGDAGHGRRYRATLRDKGDLATVSLTVEDNGRLQTLAQRDVASAMGRWVSLAVDAAWDGRVRLLLDGVEVAGRDLGRPTLGRVGLACVEGNSGFDDASIDSRAPQPGLRPVTRFSKTFREKPRYPEDNRDDQLDRWARDTDTWKPATLATPSGKLDGLVASIPLIGDFRAELPPGAAWQVLSLHDLDGAALIQKALTQPGGGAVLERRSGALWLNGQSAGALEANVFARVGVFGAAGARPAPGLFSDNYFQEFFESAPTRWLPVSGEWHVTNRWQCNPLWSFFGGMSGDDAILFSKDRFEGDQVHEFYYGMKDIFAREFQMMRYARRDVGFGFCLNGRDLSSGYAFVYGGRNNQASLLYRLGQVVAWNDRARFPPFVHRDDIDQLHLWWRRFRVEKTGPRIRVLYEDDLIFDWTDPEPGPIAGGHAALWTARNGVVYSRVNVSAQRIVNGAAAYLEPAPGSAQASGWTALDSFRLRLAPEDQGARVTTRFGGGTLAARWDLAQPVDLAKTPRLRLGFKPLNGAKVNLHAVIGGKPFLFTVNAPVKDTFRVLGYERPGAPRWAIYAAEPLAPPVVDDASFYDAQRGVIDLDLAAEARRRDPSLASLALTSLCLGNTSHHEHLIAGFGGNASGSGYWVGRPEFLAPRQ